MGTLLVAFARLYPASGWTCYIWHSESEKGEKVTLTAFAPIFHGWNVWQVWQVKDLPFSIAMIGVSPERQLRIWVEDEIRLHSSAEVADSIDLKGGQIEIIPGAPGLNTAVRKESVPGGASFLVSGAADLFTVRFFNRGEPSQIAWPHDESYLLDAVLDPNPANPATSGPPPPTIGQTVGTGITQPVTQALGSVPWYLWVAGAAVGLVLVLPDMAVRKVRRIGKRKHSS